MFHFGGSLRISSRNISWNFLSTTKSSIVGLLISTYVSTSYIAKISYPFQEHFFNCKVEICLINIGLSMPLMVLSFSSSTTQVLWDSNQSMLINNSCDPKGNTFNYVCVVNLFMFSVQFFTNFITFLLVLVAS